MHRQGSRAIVDPLSISSRQMEHSPFVSDNTSSENTFRLIREAQKHVNFELFRELFAFFGYDKAKTHQSVLSFAMSNYFDFSTQDAIKQR